MPLVIIKLGSIVSTDCDDQEKFAHPTNLKTFGSGDPHESSHKMSAGAIVNWQYVGIHPGG